MQHTRKDKHNIWAIINVAFFASLFSYISITLLSRDLHLHLRFEKRDPAGSVKHKISLVWPK